MARRKTRKRTTSSTEWRDWRPARPDCDRFFYDAEAAEKACQFFSRYLVHVKGELADQPLELAEWQQTRIIRPLFGWRRRSDGTRQYRQTLIALPRKNGKSTLGSGIGLYGLTADREPGAEIYSAAADRDQAAIVFDAAKEMVEASPRLLERVTVLKRSLVVRKTRSFYRVLSRDARTKHGQNAHMILFDELHTQRDRELWDTLRTGRASRRQPLLVAITTAGWDRHSICWEVWDYALKVEQGIIDDPYLLPVIFAAQPDADWRSPEVWSQANPGLGTSVQLSYLEEECRQAEQSPAAENVFRQLHLNQWTEQAERWMKMDRWDQCAGDPIEEAELEGRPCYTALDLSSSLDITAMVHVFPPLSIGEEATREQEEEEGGEEAEEQGLGDDPYIVLCRFFIPEENIRERVKRDKVPYDTWVEEGLITATRGEVIDNDAILAAFDVDAQRFDVREVPYDRWGAREISRSLQDRGVTVVPFGQGFGSMSAPTKDLMTLVLQRRIWHGGNPVLRWMASNAAATKDAAGNIKLDKAKSSERIDGMVALVMGLDRAMKNEGKPKASVYKRRRRGLVTL